MLSSPYPGGGALHRMPFSRSDFVAIHTNTGGVAGQLDYAVGGPGAVAGAAGGFNPAATMGYNDQSEFLDSRAEAKRAHAERMQHLRQVRYSPVQYIAAFTFAYRAVTAGAVADSGAVKGGFIS